MHNLPFDKPGRFWRGNLHTHSTLSDGHMTPDQVCAFYRDMGYDFIAITDHFMAAFDWQIADTTPYRTETFTTLYGAELHAPATEFGYPWHILAVGLPLDFAPVVDGETAPQMVKRALDLGTYIAIAHPGFYNLSEADARSLGPVHAVEVYNATSVDHNDKPDGWYLLDLLSARGHRYSACATDDAHFHPDRSDAMRGWVMVKSQSLEPDALLQALKAGDYYSSTGPQLHDVQVFPGDKVTVACSPAERIFVTGPGYVAESVHGNGITQAVISLDRFAESSYIRVTVRDAQGGRAWTSPLWFDEA